MTIETTLVEDPEVVWQNTDGAYGHTPAGNLIPERVRVIGWRTREDLRHLQGTQPARIDISPVPDAMIVYARYSGIFEAYPAGYRLPRGARVIGWLDADGYRQTTGLPEPPAEAITTIAEVLAARANMLAFGTPAPWTVTCDVRGGDHLIEVLDPEPGKSGRVSADEVVDAHQQFLSGTGPAPDVALADSHVPADVVAKLSEVLRQARADVPPTDHMPCIRQVRSPLTLTKPHGGPTGQPCQHDHGTLADPSDS